MGSSARQITYSGAMLREIGNKVNDNKYLQILIPGAINTIRRPRINKRRIRTSYRPLPTDCMSNMINLLYVKTTDNNIEEVGNNMRIATLNARSVKNKDHLIAQQLHATDVDIPVITETWLEDTDTEKAWLNQSELKQSNYTILLQKSPGPKKGGGIALMCKCQYSNDITLLEKTTTLIMEYLVCRLIHRNKPHYIIGLYHPTHIDNQMTTSTFIDEITSLLTGRITNLDNIMIPGDFNINTSISTNADNAIFNDTMAALRLKQHAHSPTCRLGSSLDLIFTQLHREVKVINVTTHGDISDHCMVSIELQLHKLRYSKIKKIITEKTKMTAEALLTNFTALTLKTNDSLEQACHKLNTELHNALEKTVPLQKIKYLDKPKQLWFNKYIRSQQKTIRSRQRAWSKYRQIYTTN